MRLEAKQQQIYDIDSLNDLQYQLEITQQHRSEAVRDRSKLKNEHNDAQCNLKSLQHYYSALTDKYDQLLQRYNEIVEEVDRYNSETLSEPLKKKKHKRKDILEDDSWNKYLSEQDNELIKEISEILDDD